MAAAQAAANRRLIWSTLRPTRRQQDPGCEQGDVFAENRRARSSSAATSSSGGARVSAWTVAPSGFSPAPMFPFPVAGGAAAADARAARRTPPRSAFFSSLGTFRETPERPSPTVRRPGRRCRGPCAADTRNGPARHRWGDRAAAPCSCGTARTSLRTRAAMQPGLPGKRADCRTHRPRRRRRHPA